MRKNAKDDNDSQSEEEKPVPPFLLKTYEMVNDNKTDDIISWTPKGDAFVVKKQHQFSTEVLPNYFRTNCFSSFVRQLNFYGFKKRTANMSTDAYFKHKNFKRGQKDKLVLIKKKTSETSNTKQIVAELQKEVKQLKEQYKQIWTVQHQILMMVTNFATRNSNSFPHLQSTMNQSKFVYPGGGMGTGIGPMPPVPPQAPIDIQGLMMSHMSAPSPAMLSAPPGTNSESSSNMFGKSTATIRELPDADLDKLPPIPSMSGEKRTPNEMPSLSTKRQKTEVALLGNQQPAVSEIGAGVMSSSLPSPGDFPSLFDRPTLIENKTGISELGLPSPVSTRGSGYTNGDQDSLDFMIPQVSPEVRSSSTNP